MNRKLLSLAMALFAVVGLFSLGANHAKGALGDTEEYFFTKITNNGNPDVASQLKVEVIDIGGDKVGFKFYNDVGTASSITDIYFDDGSLLGIASITDSDGSGTGVSFSAPASPGDLPGGTAIDFNTSTTPSQKFSADSTSGPPGTLAKGVNLSSEWVQINFNLLSGKTYADTLAAIALGMGSWGLNEDDEWEGTDVEGALRIGLHVQGIGVPGGSDSYVNTPDEDNDDQTVPEPMSLAIWGLGLGCLGLVGMRRRKA